MKYQMRVTSQNFQPEDQVNVQATALERQGNLSIVVDAVEAMELAVGSLLEVELVVRTEPKPSKRPETRSELKPVRP